MVLHTDTDASCLSLPEARSKTAAVHYLSDRPEKHHQPPIKSPTKNRPIHVISRGIKNVVSSAAEAEIVGIFEGCQEGIPLRATLEELNHPQPTTPLKTDNSTAEGIINNNMKRRKTRSLDMRYHWIRDKVQQGQFNVYWKSGLLNLADYFTKRHNEAHHIQMRKKHLHETKLDMNFRRMKTSSPRLKEKQSKTIKLTNKKNLFSRRGCDN